MNVSTMHDKGVYFCTDFQKSLGAISLLPAFRSFLPSPFLPFFVRLPLFPFLCPVSFAALPSHLCMSTFQLTSLGSTLPTLVKKWEHRPADFFHRGDKARGGDGRDTRPNKISVYGPDV